MRPEIGTILVQRYQIGREIGRGGFATVYLATDRQFEREVALKLLETENETDFEQFFDAFRREARLAARLLHPNILDVYDFGRVGQAVFLVMPYAGGGTLSQKLKQTGPLPLPTALEYVRQVAAGLALAHAQGIIHRDLKPANLLLFEDGQLVIADFGLAKLLSRLNALTNTRVSGTPPYMPPEQWQGRVGTPSDIYALGIILYQLLAGRLPFQGQTQAEVYQQHLNAPLPDIIQVRTDLPPLLPTLLADMTAKEPALRPTAANLKALLELVADPSATPEQYQALRRKQNEAAQVEPPTLETPTELLTPDSNLTTQSRPPGRPRPLANPARRARWFAVLSMVLAAIVVAQLILIVGLNANRASQPTDVAADDPHVTYAATPASVEGSYGARLYSFTDPKSLAGFFNNGQCIISTDLGLDKDNHLVGNYRCRRALDGRIDPTQFSKIPYGSFIDHNNVTSISPDGKYAAHFKSYGSDQIIRSPGVTRDAQGSPTATPRPSQLVNYGRFSVLRVSDGKEVVSLENIPSLPESYNEERNFTFSPDGHWLALLGSQSQLYLIDLAKEKLLDHTWTLVNPNLIKVFVKNLPRTVERSGPRYFLSKNGRYMVVEDNNYDEDKNVNKAAYLYDLGEIESGVNPAELKPTLSAADLTFSFDGTRLLASRAKDLPFDQDHPYDLYDLTTPQPRHIRKLTEAALRVPGKEDVYFYSPNFLPNGLIVVGASNPAANQPNQPGDAYLTLDQTDGKLLATLPIRREGEFSNNGAIMLELSYLPPEKNPALTPSIEPTPTPPPFVGPPECYFYDTRTGKRLGQIPQVEVFVGYSYDDKILITKTNEGLIELYDTTTFKKVGQLDELYPDFDEYEISPSQPLMIAKDREGLFTVWRLHP